ncbi:MAG: HEAT repeat domain-containing protein [Planctomycetia bacterium]
MKAQAQSVPRPAGAIDIIMRSLMALPREAEEGRCALLKALGETCEPAVLKVLWSASTDENKEIRKASASALSRVPHALSSYILLALLVDQSVRVRTAALRSLIRLGHPDAVKAVISSCLLEAGQQQVAREEFRSLKAGAAADFKKLLLVAAGLDSKASALVAQITAEVAGDALPLASSGVASEDTAAVGSATTGTSARVPDAAERETSVTEMRPLSSVAGANAGKAASPGVGTIFDEDSLPAESESGAAAQNRRSTIERDVEVQSADVTHQREDVARSAGGSSGGDTAPFETTEFRFSDLLDSAGEPSAAADAVADNDFFDSITSRFGELTEDTAENPSTPVTRRQQSDFELTGSRPAASDRMAAEGRVESSAAPQRFNVAGGAATAAQVPQVAGAASDESATVEKLAQQLAQLLGGKINGLGSVENSSGAVGFGNSPVNTSTFGNSGPVSPFNPGATMPSGGPYFHAGPTPAVASPGAIWPGPAASVAGHSVPSAPNNAVPWMPGLPPAVPPEASMPIADPDAGRKALAPPIANAVISEVPDRSAAAGVVETQTASDVTTSMMSIMSDETAAVLKSNAAEERRLKRLRDARSSAMRKLIQNRAEPAGGISRALQRRISALLATPDKQPQKIADLLLEIGKSGAPGVVETIAGFSEKPMKEIRLGVAKALGFIQHPDAAVQLLRMLGDKSGTVAEAAVGALITTGVSEVRPVILAAALVNTSLRARAATGIEASDAAGLAAWELVLHGEIETDDTELQLFAVSLLVRLTGPAHYENYEKLVHHPASEVRAVAVDALLRTGNKRAVSLINEAFLDPAPEVRSQAALAVATMNSPRSITLLAGCLTDPDPGVRLSAARTAAQLEDPQLAEAAVRALETEIDRDVVEFLLGCLGRNAVGGAMNVLIRYSEDNNSPHQELAIKALRRQKNRETLPVFVRLLDSPLQAVRRHGVEQLGVFRHVDSVGRLHEMLKTEPSEFVRAACAKALGDIGDKSSLGPLEEALQDHAVVRLQVVIALGRMVLPAIGPCLLSLLQDTQSEIRYQAVRGIGQLKLEDAAPQVETLLSDPDELVRRGAEQTLLELGVDLRTQKTRRWKKRVLSVWLALTPSVLAGGIPGGAKTLAGASLAIVIVACWGFLRIGNVSAGEELLVGRIAGLAFTPDSRQLLIRRNSNVFDIWDIEEPKLVDRMAAPQGIMDLWIDRDGSVIYQVDKELKRSKLMELRKVDGAQTLSMAARPSGVFYHRSSDSLFVFQSEGKAGRLKKIQCASLKQTAEFTLDRPTVGKCMVSPDESLAIVIDAVGNLVLFDLKSGKSASVSVGAMTKLPKVGIVTAVVFSADMKTLGITGTELGLVVLDVKTMKLLKHVPRPGVGNFVAAVFSGESLTAVADNGSIVTLSGDFQAADEGRISDMPGADSIAISDDADVMAAGSTEEKNVWVCSLRGKKVLHELQAEDD